MNKYIIFRADQKEEQGAENRFLSHTGAYTEILAEHFDSSNRPSPTPGYRLREFLRIKPFIDPKFPTASTHSRIGDWEVIRVDEYIQQSSNTEFDSIVICYCRYIPVTSPLQPLPQIEGKEHLQEI